MTDKEYAGKSTKKMGLRTVSIKQETYHMTQVAFIRFMDRHELAQYGCPA